MNTDRDSIGAALGRIPSGCMILTAQNGECSTGLLVSWVQQASFEPPSVTVCLKCGRAVVQLVDASQRFLLNVIGEDRGAMFRHFARGFSLGEEAFTGLRIEATQFGPMIHGCIAHLGCRVSQKIPVGDHDLYIAEVVAGSAVDGAKPYAHLRTSGLSY